MTPRLAMRLALAAMLVTAALSVGAPATGQHSQAATLRDLFVEMNIDAGAVPGVPLDRRISNYAYDNGDDLFAVAFYWDDELATTGRANPGLLPHDFHVLAFDKRANRWVSRTFDDRKLPGTGETPRMGGMGSIVRLSHNPRYVLVGGHQNPSSGGLLVLTRDLEPKGFVWGWPLFSAPDGSIVYHRGQVHFAPTHPLEVFMYDPRSGVDRKIYPLKPYGSPRRAFMKALQREYGRAGEAWCRDNNHQCDPEQFDSSWQGPWVVDAQAQAAAFVVRFGMGHVGREPEWPDDRVPTQQVVVTCRNLSAISRVACGETPLRTIQAEHPNASVEEVLTLAAREASRR